MTGPDLYLGVHRAHWLEQAGDVPVCVAFGHLDARRRGGDAMPHARGDWVLDSGGFTELQRYGQWRLDPDTYGGAVTRIIEDCGRPPRWVATQDMMCEPWIIHGGVHGGQRFAGTGLDVATHQELTVDSYVWLAREFPFIPWLPVVQGWTLDDYVRCVDLYAAAGVDLRDVPAVGLGSVCRRQSTREIAVIASTLAGYGLRLHGFGVKTQGLAGFARHLVSADTAAWSLDARRAKRPTRGPSCRHRGDRCNNCWSYAVAWRDRVLKAVRRPRQLELFDLTEVV